MPKSRSAVAMGRKRWKGTSTAERSADARKRGLATAAKLTPEEHSERMRELGRKGAAAQWGVPDEEEGGK